MWTTAAWAGAVAVIEPGAEPRAPLRLALREGASELVLAGSAQATVAVGGPIPDPPPSTTTTRTTASVRVLRSDATGSDVEVVLTGVARDVVPPPRRAPPLPPGALDGSRGVLRIDPTGAVVSAAWTFPPGLDARGLQAANGAAKGLVVVLPRFPEEAVGVGARWRVVDRWDVGPLSVDVASTWTLSAVDAAGATLAVTYTASAPAGELDLGPDAAVDATLRALTARGAATVRQPFDRLVGERVGDLVLHAELTGSKGPLSVDITADVTQTQDLRQASRTP